MMLGLSKRPKSAGPERDLYDVLKERQRITNEIGRLIRTFNKNFRSCSHILLLSHERITSISHSIVLLFDNNRYNLMTVARELPEIFDLLRDFLERELDTVKEILGLAAEIKRKQQELENLNGRVANAIAGISKIKKMPNAIESVISIRKSVG